MPSSENDLFSKLQAMTIIVQAFKKKNKWNKALPRKHDI